MLIRRLLARHTPHLRVNNAPTAVTTGDYIIYRESKVCWLILKKLKRAGVDPDGWVNCTMKKALCRLLIRLKI